jgi:hypothetical protein
MLSFIFILGCGRLTPETEQSTFIVQQKLGDSHLTLSDLKEKLQTGDQSIANKIL